MANLKDSKITNLEVIENLKAKILNADIYNNLPLASHNEAGTVKIDEETIIMDEEGKIKVAQTSKENETLQNHVLNTNIHLNSTDRINIDKVNEHVGNTTNQHLTETQIKLLDTLNNHILNNGLDGNLHLTPQEKNQLLQALDTLATHLQGHVSKEIVENMNYHITNGDIHTTTEEKASNFKKDGYEIDKVFKTDDTGKIVYADCSGVELSYLSGLDKNIMQKFEDVDPVNHNHDTLYAPITHVTDTMLHFTLGEKEEMQEQINTANENLTELADEQSKLQNQILSSVGKSVLKIRYIRDSLLASDNKDMEWVQCVAVANKENVALNKTVTTNIANADFNATISKYTNGIKTIDNKIVLTDAVLTEERTVTEDTTLDSEDEPFYGNYDLEEGADYSEATEDTSGTQTDTTNEDTSDNTGEDTSSDTSSEGTDDGITVEEGEERTKLKDITPYLQIDLGQAYENIEYIRIYHGFDNSQQFTHTLQVSENGEDWTTIFDSGQYGIYTETASGQIYIINANEFYKRILDV